MNPAAACAPTGSEAGYSLVELLISSLLSSLILGGLYTALFQSQVTFEAQLVSMEARQQARVAVDRVIPDARMAGFRIDNLPEAVEAATADSFTFVGDIDNGSPEPPCDATIENAVNGGAERVTYGVSGSELVRAVECWNGTAWVGGVKEIIARDVVARLVSFRYFDGAGIELDPGAGGLSASERARVRSLEFSVGVAEGDVKWKFVEIETERGEYEYEFEGWALVGDVHLITGSASLRNVR